MFDYADVSVVNQSLQILMDKSRNIKVSRFYFSTKATLTCNFGESKTHKIVIDESAELKIPLFVWKWWKLIGDALFKTFVEYHAPNEVDLDTLRKTFDSQLDVFVFKKQILDK